jgi:hypothetical protein
MRNNLNVYCYNKTNCPLIFPNRTVAIVVRPVVVGSPVILRYIMAFYNVIQVK